jgi:ubiquinone/menaquinone biosynthesis C-methylase UbiE
MVPDIRLLVKLATSAVSTRSTRGFYDHISSFYDSLFTEHLAHVRKMAAALKEELAARDRIKVLDLACGTGALSCELKQHGFSVTGLDFSHLSLRGLGEKSKTIYLVQSDATALPFVSASFDVVTCMGAWRHFSHPELVLEEICRVLTRNGVFFVGYFPPKLGGLISVPNGKFGNVIARLYRCLVEFCRYDDSVGEQTGHDAFRMIEMAFARCRTIPSGKHEYLIFSESPHKQHRASQ